MANLRMLPTNQIWRYWGLESFLADVEAAGMRDVDLWLCNQHIGIDAHGIYNSLELVAALDRHGVRVRTLTPEQGNPKVYNIASTDMWVRCLTHDYYAQVAELAQKLGVVRISMNAGWFPFDVERGAAWEAMASMLVDICDMAAAVSVSVCLETLAERPYRLVCDLDSLKRVLADVSRPNLMATLDTATIARNGESLADYLVALGSRVGYVHLTNLDPAAMAHLAWGDPDGVLDARSVLGELARGGYVGDCALEMTCESYFGRPWEILSRAKEALEGCGGKC